MGEEQDTVEDVYEPYLLQRGFIERTPRGRAATRRAWRHLGLEPPAEAAQLFCSSGSASICAKATIRADRYRFAVP